MADKEEFKEEIQRKRLERMFSTERTDQMLQITRPRRWVVLALVFALLIGLIVWSFIGRIPTEVEGRGVVLSPNGVFTIEAKAKGTVTEILVKEGDTVRQGKHVVTIHNPERRALLKNIEVTQSKIMSLETELQVLKERLEAREELFKEGLIPKTTFEDTKIAVLEKKISIDESKSTLTKLFTELEKISSLEDGSFNEQMLARFTKNGINHEALDVYLSKIYNPSDGTILEVLVNEDDLVNEDEPLIWMERSFGFDETMIVYCCVPVQTQDRIRPGMDVRIEPTIVNPQEYGVMLGTVKEVSPYVVSEEDLIHNLHNKQLVEYLTGGAIAVTRIIVEPKVDKQTQSGFRWTSEKGPPFEISTGTLCAIKILVEEQPPISYLIPLWTIKP